MRLYHLKTSKLRDLKTLNLKELSLPIGEGRGGAYYHLPSAPHIILSRRVAK